MKKDKVGQKLATAGQSVCELCGNPFNPIVDPQRWCSATCARAVKDMDELGRVYAELDERHRRGWFKQQEGRNDQKN